MTGHLARAAANIAGVLQTAGIRTTIDPRNLTPPCIAVTPLRAERLTRKRVTVEVQAVCVAPGPANLDALEAVDNLAAAATAALDTAGVPWQTGAVAMMNNGPAGDALLTYALTINYTTEV